MTGLDLHIERFRRIVESAAREDGPAPFFSVKSALLVLSVLYGGAMVIRALLYKKGVLSSRTLPCRVISIGNLIAG